MNARLINIAFVLSLIIGCFIIGCGKDSTALNDAIDAISNTVPVNQTSIDFTVLDTDSYAPGSLQMNKRIEVITTQSSFDEIYAHILPMGGNTPKPTVNFDKSIVIALAMGTQPDVNGDVPKIEVSTVLESDKVVTVNVVSTLIADGCPAGLSHSNPYSFVSLSKTFKEIIFRESIAYRECANSTPPPACTSYSYSEWSECTYGTQSRTMLSKTPSNCTGTPVLSQYCTPTTPGFNGVALYKNYCEQCHGDLLSSTKKGRTSDQIKAAIASDPMNRQEIGLQNLSDADIQAIAQALR